MKFSPASLNFWRTNRNTTVKDLSRATGIKASNIQSYEEGITVPSAKSINIMAEVLSVSPILLTDVAEKHKYINSDLYATSVPALIFLGRINNGWSRKDLAVESGCSKHVIASIEAGNSNSPRWENIWKLAQCLSIPREKISFS